MKSFRKEINCTDSYEISVRSEEDERCEITLTDSFCLHDSMSALLTLEEVKELREVLDQYIGVTSALS